MFRWKMYCIEISVNVHINILFHMYRITVEKVYPLFFRQPVGRCFVTMLDHGMEIAKKGRLKIRENWRRASRKIASWILGTGFPTTRVRRHFASKRNETKRTRNLFRFDAKKCFFRLFRIDAKHINQKRNENETKRKRNEKEAKNAVIFASKRNEAKRKRNLFRFDAKKWFFACFRFWSETKMKWCENKTKKKRKSNEKEAKKDKVKFWDNL